MNISSSQIAALPSPKYVFAAKAKWCIVEMSGDGWINQPARPPEKIFDTYKDAEIELRKIANPFMIILEMTVAYRPAFQ